MIYNKKSSLVTGKRLHSFGVHENLSTLEAAAPPFEPLKNWYRDSRTRKNIICTMHDPHQMTKEENVKASRPRLPPPGNKAPPSVPGKDPRMGDRCKETAKKTPELDKDDKRSLQPLPGLFKARPASRQSDYPSARP